MGRQNDSLDFDQLSVAAAPAGLLFGLAVSGVDGNRRGHVPEGNGAAIVATLDRLIGGKVDIVLRTRVRELLIDHGRVAGIRLDGQDVRSSAVVITTGGFGANPGFTSSGSGLETCSLP